MNKEPKLIVICKIVFQTSTLLTKYSAILGESLRHLASLLGGKILNVAKLRLRFCPLARSANLAQIFTQTDRLFR